jgi:hypothetical protein
VRIIEIHRKGHETEKRRKNEEEVIEEPKEIEQSG